MLDEVLAWGLIPSYITGDSWYSSKENLKHIKHAELGFMFAVKANRTVSIKQGEWLQVQQIDHVPKTGLEVWLKDFGFVTLYRHHFKDQVRHCVKCGNLAYVSHRTVLNDKRVLLGEKEEYEPLCRCCYQKALKEDVSK
jgi:aspartate carbamoyltransferase regulatory subunit